MNETKSFTPEVPTRIMVDIETWGTKPGAVLVAIGAVTFSVDGVKDLFDVRISPESCSEIGLEIDASTMRWWLQQGEEARREASRADGIHIRRALEMFAYEIEQARPLRQFEKGVQKRGPVEIWGNGPSFDNGLLVEAYRRAGVSLPWLYGKERCFRTLRMLYPEVARPEMREGVFHTALDDARNQAQQAVEILRLHEARRRLSEGGLRS